MNFENAAEENICELSSDDLTQFSVYIETTQAGTIGKFFESLQSNVNEINMWFTQNNMTSMSLDATNQCVTFVRLESRNFEIWHVDNRFVAGINMPTLYRLVKDSIKAKNTVTMFVRKNDQRFFVRVNNGTSYDCSYVPLLQLQQANIQIPEIQYDTFLSMSSHAFLQYCKTCVSTTTRVIRMSTRVENREPKNYTLTVETVGMTNPSGKSITIGSSQDDLIFRLSNRVNNSGLYTLRLCQNIAKSCVMSDHVHIIMHPGQPTVFQYDCGNLGYVKYYLYEQTMIE